MLPLPECRDPVRTVFPGPRGRTCTHRCGDATESGGYGVISASLFEANSVSDFVLNSYLKGRQRDGERPSASSLSRWLHSYGWARLKPEALISIKVSHMSAGLVLCFSAFPGAFLGSGTVRA